MPNKREVSAEAIRKASFLMHLYNFCPIATKRMLGLSCAISLGLTETQSIRGMAVVPPSILANASLIAGSAQLFAETFSFASRKEEEDHKQHRLVTQNEPTNFHLWQIFDHRLSGNC